MVELEDWSTTKWYLFSLFILQLTLHLTKIALEEGWRSLLVTCFLLPSAINFLNISHHLRVRMKFLSLSLALAPVSASHLLLLTCYLANFANLAQIQLPA